MIPPITIWASLNSVGRNDEAVEAYKKALAISPNYAAAHNNLAISYYRTGMYDRALFHYNMARKLGQPADPAFSATLDQYRNKR